MANLDLTRFYLYTDSSLEQLRTATAPAQVWAALYTEEADAHVDSSVASNAATNNQESHAVANTTAAETAQETTSASPRPPHYQAAQQLERSMHAYASSSNNPLTLDLDKLTPVTLQLEHLHSDNCLAYLFNWLLQKNFAHHPRPQHLSSQLAKALRSFLECSYVATAARPAQTPTPLAQTSFAPFSLRYLLTTEQEVQLLHSLHTETPATAEQLPTFGQIYHNWQVLQGWNSDSNTQLLLLVNCAKFRAANHNLTLLWQNFGQQLLELATSELGVDWEAYFTTGRLIKVTPAQLALLQHPLIQHYSANHPSFLPYNLRRKQHIQGSRTASNTSNTNSNIGKHTTTEILSNISLELFALQQTTAPYLLKHYVPAILDIVAYNAIPPVTQRGLLLMDMDSTIIDIECIDEIANILGVKEQVAAITDRAMHGNLDFAQAMEQRLELLKGTDYDKFRSLQDSLNQHYNIDATFTQYLREQGNWVVALVSGGFVDFAKYVAADLEFNEFRANTLEVQDGKLTGKLLTRLVDREYKAEYLEQLAQEKHVDFTVTIGDGNNDLSMLRNADYSVGYHFKNPTNGMLQQMYFTNSNLSMLTLFLQARKSLDQLVAYKQIQSNHKFLNQADRELAFAQVFAELQQHGLNSDEDLLINHQQNTQQIQLELDEKNPEELSLTQMLYLEQVTNLLKSAQN